MHDEGRWYEAARDGDPGFDGRFFAGVVTTGVYCRSVCPVPRPPKRENVRFYSSAAGAERAGFRPCRTCRPERSAGTPPWSGLPPVVSRALVLIAQGALDEAGVDELAARLGLGSRHLRRLFDEYLGASPVAIAKARRTHFARRLIDETDLPMTEIAFAAGFRTLRQFNHDLRRTFGRSPTELRRRKPRRSGGEREAPEIKLPYRPPLDWPRMIEFLRGRATPGVEVAEHDRYRRTIRVDGRPGAIEIRVVANEPHLLLRVWLPSLRGLIGVAERARRVFDLAADPAEVAARLGPDPVLGPLVRARPGLRVPGAWDPFEAAVRAILGQQISVRAASALATRLVERFGEPAEGVEVDGLTHLFPTPATLAEADVRAIGTTGSQARAIGALASAVASGEPALEASPDLDEFVARICELPGVGPWTAQYLAMRALGEPDAFPAGDLGLRRAVANGRVVSEREMRLRAEEWRPWRAYAAMYLWTAGTNGGGKAKGTAKPKRSANTGGKKATTKTTTKESR